MDADFTLEKAKQMVRQCEAIHEHQEILNGSPSTQTLQRASTLVRQKDRHKSS